MSEQRVSIMRLFIGLLYVGVLFVGLPVFAETKVEGTVEAADPTIMRIMIILDDGKKDSYSVTGQSILKGIEKGDRVVLEVGSDGMASRVTKMTASPSQGQPASPPTK